MGIYSALCAPLCHHEKGSQFVFPDFVFISLGEHPSKHFLLCDSSALLELITHMHLCYCMVERALATSCHASPVILTNNFPFCQAENGQFGSLYTILAHLGPLQSILDRQSFKNGRQLQILAKVLTVICGNSNLHCLCHLLR